MQFVFGSDRIELNRTEWCPREDKIVQTRVRSCEGSDRNAVSFQGTNGFRYHVHGRTDMGTWDHVKEVEDDVEDVTVLWYGGRRLHAII